MYLNEKDKKYHVVPSFEENLEQKVECHIFIKETRHEGKQIGRDKSDTRDSASMFSVSHLSRYAILEQSG